MLIAHVTDTHIALAGPAARDFTAILRTLHARARRPDAIVLGGDCVHAGTRAEYARLREIIATSEIPLYLVPGNHDERDALRAELPARYFPGAHERLTYAVDDGDVRLIGLDTAEFRRVGGSLDDATLGWLDATLGARPDRPTLIFMHHPPFHTGVRLADLFGFRGRRAFVALVARYPCVLRIVAGHIHCVREARIAHALASTSPSTTPQSVPELFEQRPIGRREESAGYALLTFGQGAFTTEYERIDPHPWPGTADP